LKFHAFQAMQGDAFVLSDGNTKLLLDGGMPSTYGQISEFEKESELRAVIISHVDYDHLGGVFRLLSDHDIVSPHCEYYMNHPEFPSEYNGEEVGFKHGHSLADLLQSNGKRFNSLVRGDSLFIGSFQIDVLAPEAEIVEELYRQWGTNITYDGEKLSYLKRQKTSQDIINNSSLVLLVKYGNSRLLFLGDAHMESAVTSLRRIGSSVERRAAFDLIKLSHHGSEHNISEDFLKLIDCNNYYISTNGAKYDHPDAATILLLQERAAELNTKFNIYLNYDIRDDIALKCNSSLANLNLLYEQSLEFTGDTL